VVGETGGDMGAGGADAGEMAVISLGA